MTEISPIQCLVGLGVLAVVFFSGPLLRWIVKDEAPVIVLAILLVFLGIKWIARWSNPDFSFVLQVILYIAILVILFFIFRSFRKYDEKQREPVSATRYDEDRILVRGGRGEIERLLHKGIPGLMHSERVGGSFLLTIRHRSSDEINSVVDLINRNTEW